MMRGLYESINAALLSDVSLRCPVRTIGKNHSEIKRILAE